MRQTAFSGAGRSRTEGIPVVCGCGAFPQWGGARPLGRSVAEPDTARSGPQARDARPAEAAGRREQGEPPRPQAAGSRRQDAGGLRSRSGAKARTIKPGHRLSEWRGREPPRAKPPPSAGFAGVYTATVPPAERSPKG